ncbi:MAG: FG-GAP repeat domain-containing protein [Opitutaceae bacterium]
MLRLQSLFLYTFALLCALFALTSPSYAVINPALQPDVYYDKYPNVVVLKVEALDADTFTVQTKVVEVIKGDYAIDSPVAITFTGGLDEVLISRIADASLSVGDEFPAFAGKPSRRKSIRQVRAYADEFYVGEVKKVGEWVVGADTEMETDPDGNPVNTLAGIYCGMTSQLVELLRHMASASDFYPRKAYVKFKEDVLIDTLEASVEGIAMYDLNGDGLEDIVAASSAGDRVYLQIEPMVFKDASESLGIDSKSVSCSVADFDCDGLNDLLLGDVLYHAQFENSKFAYTKTDWLPIEEATDLKTASFVDFDNDGFPDVLVSIAGKGLQSWMNPGEKVGAFNDVSTKLGFSSAEFADGGNGYFSIGDWDDDGDSDIFYAYADGYLLAQSEAGVYFPVSHDVDFIFRTGVDTYGQTGAGVFMPTYHGDKNDLIVPIEKDWLIIQNNGGVVEDITKWGNEISEGSDYHLATVAADLNLDGYTDIYTISDEKKENRFIINRGYGSYMHAKIHVDEKPLFKGPAHGSGGRSVAVGDINADHQPDILIGNADGQILLIQNDTLSMRQEGEYLKKDELRLLEMRVCSVRVLGPKGLIGAKVRLLDAQGKVVVRRDLGGNVATGCSSPDLLNLVVRAPGKYVLKVVYADNYERTIEVDLTGEAPVSVVVQRLDGVDDDVW